jgi:flagellar assembly protein FliH
MNWSETIPFPQPLLYLAVMAGAPSEDWVALLQEREQEGYERGRRDGENGVKEQMAKLKTEIAGLQTGILESLSQALPKLVNDSETALIGIALEAAKRVVAEMPIDVAMVEAVIKEALRQTEDTAEILVQLHADDLTLLRENDSKILQGLLDKGPLRFIASADVSRGGCIVQTRFGIIDARREIKFEQLAQSATS